MCNSDAWSKISSNRVLFKKQFLHENICQTASLKRKRNKGAILCFIFFTSRLAFQQTDFFLAKKAQIECIPLRPSFPRWPHPPHYNSQCKQSKVKERFSTHYCGDGLVSVLAFRLLKLNITAGNKLTNEH